MFLFSKPVIEACGAKFPKYWFPASIVKGLLTIWQRLHFALKFPEPPLEPLAIERISLDNYFSIDKARRDLGYEPRYTTEEAMKECMPFYVELFNKMKIEAGKA